MTFTQIKAAIKDYCLLTSTEADTRVGTAINRHYRRITSQLGMDATRFVTRTQATTPDGQTVTFTAIEKIDRVLDTTDLTARRLLGEVSLHALRAVQPGTGPPTEWALQNTDAAAVTILLDTQPTTVRSLQADGWTTLTDLTGNDQPVFPESFHDVLVWFVISEELLKKEKLPLAGTYEQKAEKLLADLRFHLADSHMRVTQQASPAIGPLAGGGAGGGGLTSHAPTHEAGGSDPIDITQLEGVITLDQLVPHDTTHKPGGSDELVTAAWTDVANVFTEPQTLQSDTGDLESGASRFLDLVDLTQASGARRWQLLGLASDLLVRATNDTGGSPTVDTLRLDRTGNALVSNALTAANVVTEGATIQTSTPILNFIDNAQPAGSQRWQVYGFSTNLQMRAAPDSGGPGGVDVFTLNRLGDAIVGRDAAINRDLYEKSRTTALGHWIDVPFSAGNFGATGGGWTVAAGNVSRFSYMLAGNTAWIQLFLDGSTTTGTPSSLNVIMPVTLAAFQSGTYYYYVAPAFGHGVYQQPSADTVLRLYRDVFSTAFAAAAGTVVLRVSLAVQIV